VALARANLGAFGLEGLAFAGSAQGIHHAMGREVIPGTSFGKELGHAYLTMGLLRTFGGATHAALYRRYHKIPAPFLSLQDKIILKTAPQAAQFGGIYLSHTLAPRLGLGEYMDPGERAFQSAVSLVHFGAAGHLLNRMPGYLQANQKIHLEAQRLGAQIRDYWRDYSALPMRSLAAPGIGIIGLGPVPSPALRANEMRMSASNNDGAGKGDPVTITAVPISDSEPPLGTTQIRAPRGKRSRIDETASSAPGGESTPDTLLGQTLDGRYQVESILGIGGMGKVYLGRHKQLNKAVAIKVLLDSLASREDINQRFINEARAASMIGNPHIIDVSDFGQLPNGSTYFVMEYLRGQSLGELIVPGKPLPLHQLLNISLQVTEGMAAAHDAQIVHRDLKPDNIFLYHRGRDKEFVKILDFGIAKVPTDSKLTLPGVVFGSPDYLSPEQAAGRRVDHRSDVYSMGIILYEMATGRLPFSADNYEDILRMHLTQEPPLPRSFVPDPKALPPGLEAIILKALCKDPAERYQGMNELQADLLRIQMGLRPEALNYRKWIKDWRPWAGLLGTALAGGAAAVLLQDDPEEGESLRSSPLPPAPEKPNPATPLAETPEPPPPSHQGVQITVLPSDAHVFSGEEDLGRGPVSLQILQGEKLDVEVRRRGYKSETLSLDGSRPEISVKLKPLRPNAPVAKPPPISKPPKSPPPRSSSDEIVRPW
jgi:serine/threonine-protein kinase